MDKFMRSCIVSLTSFSLLVGSTRALAQVAPDSLCKPQGTAFLFFNGVDTTPYQARIALHVLERQYGTKDAQGEEMGYDVMYNESKGLEDFVEIFEQRLKENTIYPPSGGFGQ